MAERYPGLSDEVLTEIMGEKCPERGHRDGKHRPALMGDPACSQWTPKADA